MPETRSAGTTSRGTSTQSGASSPSKPRARGCGSSSRRRTRSCATASRRARHGRRRVAHRRGARGRRLRGRARPAHARRDHAVRPPARAGREPRGRRARQVRRAAPRAAEGYDPSVATDLRPAETASPFATIEEAIEDIRSGRFVVVVDDADRENEGDLTIAAQFVTPEAITFMATHGRGLICLCLTPERCDELELRPMTDHNETPLGTAFTVSIEAREGVSTGNLGARSRAHHPGRDRSRAPCRTTSCSPATSSRCARRPAACCSASGQTEAAVDLARLAGLNPRRRRLRDHERRRDDGPRARSHGLLRAARAQDGHGRRPHRVPAAHREAGRARRLGAAPDGVRRVPGGRVPGAPHRQAAPRAREGRDRGRGERPRARALRVPHRRRLPLAPAATAESSSSARSHASRPRAAASSSTWGRRDAVSDS